MSDSYSFDTPYTPDIERLAKQAQSAYDAYPSPEKADAVQREVAATKGREIAEKDPIRDRQIGRLRSDLGNVDRKYRDIQPLQSQPWRPDDHPISNPLEAFGSYAGVFAMVASAATRQPIENTLNAGAAAINSVRNADLASYERAHTAWKENFDQSLKVHQAEREDYKDAIENMKVGKEGADAELAAVSAKYGDKIIQQYLAAGMNKEAMDIIAKRADLADKLLTMAPQLQEIGQKQYENVLFQSRVKEINAEHERDGKPRMNAQELVQLRGEIAQQMKNTDPDVIHTRRLEDQAERELLARDPNATGQEIARVRGDVRRSATAAFTPSKIAALDKETRIDEIMEEAKASGKPISRYEARLRADAEGIRAKTNPATLEKLGSVERAKKMWLDDHPEANGVIPPSVENDIRAKANARAIASAEPSISDKASKLLAERVIEGNMSALTGLGYGAVGAANRAKVINDVTEMAAQRNMDGAAMARRAIEYSATGRGASSLAQLEARTTGAITKAQATAPRVLEISDKIDRTRFPSINSLILSAQKGVGGENVVRLGVAVETFINNYALALGAGNAAMTDSSKQHARELLERGYSKGQMHAAIDQMLIEMDSELIGIKRGMTQYLSPANPAGQAAKTTPPADLDPIHVSTPEEAMTYPAGTPIIMPDGTRGTVPKEAQ